MRFCGNLVGYDKQASLCHLLLLLLLL